MWRKYLTYASIESNETESWLQEISPSSIKTIAWARWDSIFQQLFSRAMHITSAVVEHMMKLARIMVDRKRTYAVMPLFFLIPLLGGAQSQLPTLRTESNVVTVPTLVVDQRGNTVFGLHAADFIIEDDGNPQPVSLDEMVDSTPLSIVIAIQVGRSAKTEFPRIAKFDTMLEPIMAHGNARVSLVTFDSQVTRAKPFTTEVGDLSPVLRNLRPGDEGAAILNAIRYSVTLLEDEPVQRQRVLLLMSETRDHGSKIVNLDEVVRIVQISNTLVYALAFGPALSNVLDDLRGKLEPTSKRLNMGKLAELGRQGLRKNVAKAAARLTGGEYELFKSGREFQDYLNKLTNHLYSRYWLFFTPQDPKPGPHLLKVQVRGSEVLQVISRPTYWAKAPAH
jgi:VWFA-related protein